MYGVSALLFAMASLVALSAGAQRTDDNAVTAAGDAFGNTVGLQTIGLYSPTNARGFNPAQAENLRIEGLYYDQQISYSNPFLFSRSDMRVGTRSARKRRFSRKRVSRRGASSRSSALRVGGVSTTTMSNSSEWTSS